MIPGCIQSTLPFLTKGEVLCEAYADIKFSDHNYCLTFRLGLLFYNDRDQNQPPLPFNCDTARRIQMLRIKFRGSGDIFKMFMITTDSGLVLWWKGCELLLLPLDQGFEPSLQPCV